MSFYYLFFTACLMVFFHPIGRITSIPSLCASSHPSPSLLLPLLFLQRNMSDSLTKNALSLEDLGVSPIYLEDKVIAMLRMYRNHMTMDKPIEDTHPAYPRAAPTNSNPTYYD